VTLESPRERPILFTRHARLRMEQRGTHEKDVREAIRTGQREAAQRGLALYRINLFICLFKRKCGYL
jgi:hypothetical protein